MSTNPVANIRRLIAGGRGAGASHGRRNNRAQYQTFTKDIVLLLGPTDNMVPKQSAKYYLHNSKHIIQGVEVDKSSSPEVLLERLTCLFLDKLNGASCEIMIACGHYLVTPNLPPGQVLDGINLHRCLKSSNSIYLRPSKKLNARNYSTDDDNDDDDGNDDIPDIQLSVSDDDVVEVPSNARDTRSPVHQDEQSDELSDEPSEEQAMKEGLEQAKRAAARSGDANLAIQAYVKAIRRSDARLMDPVSLSTTIEGAVVPICVARHDIITTACDELADAENRAIETFDTRLPLEVTFNLESCEDYGGPRKEFFSMFLREAGKLLVTDENNGKVLSHDEDVIEMYVARRLYYYFGLVTGLSVLQGGIVNYMDEWNGNGAHYRQLREGLERSGLWQLMEQIESVRKLMSTKPETFSTATQFLRLFSFKAADQGSNTRRLQDESYKRFVKYVRQVYGGKRTIILEDILKFTTGSPNQPVCGYGIPPSIEFNVQAQWMPTASTCTNTLYLPIPELMQKFPEEAELYTNFDSAFAIEYFGLQ